jgi:hypothetical protein
VRVVERDEIVLGGEPENAILPLERELYGEPAVFAGSPRMRLEMKPPLGTIRFVKLLGPHQIGGRRGGLSEQPLVAPKARLFSKSRDAPCNLPLRFQHLCPARQSKVKERRFVVRHDVQVRERPAARGARFRLDHDGIVFVQRCAFAQTDKTARIDPIPAPLTAIVFDPWAAGIHDRSCAQVAVARSARSGIRVDPGSERRARQLQTRGLERQVVVTRSEHRQSRDSGG